MSKVAQRMSGDKVLVKGSAEFKGQMEHIMDSYIRQIEDQLPTIVKDTAKDCVQKIKATGIAAGIPNKAYLKGWKYRTDEVNYVNGTYCTVFNEKHYRLAHLLEHGHYIDVHGKDTGKKTAPRQHLATAADWAVEKLEATIKRMIEKEG